MNAAGRLLGDEQIIGRSPAFLCEMQKVRRVARCDAPVLISGETGTGKELCARAIHRLGRRRGKPFVPLAGGAIPADLVENELFGHAREAFTGATTPRSGLVAQAEGGTLFLDEIDSFPLSSQVKLLRFLQDLEYRPLGARRSRQADVRILAATNGDLGQLLDEGSLRSDLYYRLNTVPIMLPPLRHRQEDIVPLARHFLQKHGAELGAKARRFSPEALMKLQLHRWPGNVRELEQVVQRAVILGGDGEAIGKAAIQLDCKPGVEPSFSFQEAKAQVVAEFERSFIESLLRAHRGNITRAARTAQKNRRAFWELMRKHGIDADRYRHLES